METEHFPDAAELVARARAGQHIVYLADSQKEIRERLAEIRQAASDLGADDEIISSANGAEGYRCAGGGSITFLSALRRPGVLRGLTPDVLVVDVLMPKTEQLLDISIIRRGGAEVFER